MPAFLSKNLPPSPSPFPASSPSPVPSPAPAPAPAIASLPAPTPTPHPHPPRPHRSSPPVSSSVSPSRPPSVSAPASTTSTASTASKLSTATSTSASSSSTTSASSHSSSTSASFGSTTTIPVSASPKPAVGPVPSPAQPPSPPPEPLDPSDPSSPPVFASPLNHGRNVKQHNLSAAVTTARRHNHARNHGHAAVSDTASADTSSAVRNGASERTALPNIPPPSSAFTSAVASAPTPTSAHPSPSRLSHVPTGSAEEHSLVRLCGHPSGPHTSSATAPSTIVTAPLSAELGSSTTAARTPATHSASAPYPSRSPPSMQSINDASLSIRPGNRLEPTVVEGNGKPTAHQKHNSGQTDNHNTSQNHVHPAMANSEPPPKSRPNPVTETLSANAAEPVGPASSKVNSAQLGSKSTRHDPSVFEPAVTTDSVQTDSAPSGGVSSLSGRTRPARISGPKSAASASTPTAAPPPTLPDSSLNSPLNTAPSSLLSPFPNTSSSQHPRSSTSPAFPPNSRSNIRTSYDTSARPSQDIGRPSLPDDPITGRNSSMSFIRSGNGFSSARRESLSVPGDRTDDEAGPSEQLKSRRSSRRKRRDYDDDRVVMGTKVDQNHVNWVTAYNMLTGIRYTVSRTNAKLDRPLTHEDFIATNKFSFDITGNELTPSAKYDFKFKDYAPWVFRRLRRTFQLDPADYLMSLTSKYILSELGSPGKSGSFFYFSRDYKYIIKTIHRGEHKFLRKILHRYYDHAQNNPNTLLSQFYGLHRVKMPFGRKIHFVVMNNLFPPHRDIHETYDLKGSTIGREYPESKIAANPRATLKDINWMRHHQHLEFGPAKREAFFDQLVKDVRLLQELHVMDYSLLVGIHNLDKGNEEQLRDKTLQVFQPTDEDPDEPDPGPLTRTPSTLEKQHKARELRQKIRSQRPVPLSEASSRMPDELEEERYRKHIFYRDNGGIRATHEDNAPGNEIYYLGIIDCLTHYGFVKRMEHFLKGISYTESQLSAIPPVRYGERFLRFIIGIAMSRERAETVEQATGQADLSPVERIKALTSQSIPEALLTPSTPMGGVGSGGRPSTNVPPSTPLPITPQVQPQAQNQQLPIVDEAGEVGSEEGDRDGAAEPDRNGSARPRTRNFSHPHPPLPGTSVVSDVGDGVDATVSTEPLAESRLHPSSNHRIDSSFPGQSSSTTTTATTATGNTAMTNGTMSTNASTAGTAPMMGAAVGELPPKTPPKDNCLTILHGACGAAAGGVPLMAATATSAQGPGHVRTSSRHSVSRLLPAGGGVREMPPSAVALAHRVSRASLNKALPPLPPQSDADSAGLDSHDGHGNGNGRGGVFTKRTGTGNPDGGVDVTGVEGNEGGVSLVYQAREVTEWVAASRAGAGDGVNPVAPSPAETVVRPQLVG